MGYSFDLGLEKEMSRCGGLDLGREIGAKVGSGLDLDLERERERERERGRVIWSRSVVNPALLLFNLRTVLL